MRINPIALIFWTFCGLIGYLIGDTRGAIWGVTLGMGLSLLANVL